MERTSAKRLRKPNKKTKNNCRFKKIKKEIQKAKKRSSGINKNEIVSYLKCSDSFIGCFAEDELNISISFPIFLIVNIDRSDMKGSHWIAIGIFKDEVEIFDPLGFDIFTWSRVPCHLLNFLHRLSVSRNVSVLKRIQSDSSTLCGFYCIFYVLFRPYNSFKRIENSFRSYLAENDFTLIKRFT